MFSENGLDKLTSTFNEQLPDDTGNAQLGLLLIGQLRTTRRSLVEAAIPLEVLAGQISRKPYKELSPDIQKGIVDAVQVIRQTLESHDCSGCTVDPFEHAMEHSHVDTLDFSDETRNEYFDCVCHSDEHLFKIALDPEDGSFFLSTYLHQYRSFWSRLWTGLKYICGYKSKYGHWDVVELDLRSVERLHRLTNEALDAMAKHADKNIKAA